MAVLRNVSVVLLYLLILLLYLVLLPVEYLVNFLNVLADRDD
ncbi:MAG: hypothetical protein NZM35_03650 [Chitinophagales bacterium]|nr:hypothetical protein [Chitinophagales bacterium]MDW8418381.1 hypothetical protein [Chitinophagales bacterium]